VNQPVGVQAGCGGIEAQGQTGGGDAGIGLKQGGGNKSVARGGIKDQVSA